MFHSPAQLLFLIAIVFAVLSYVWPAYLLNTAVLLIAIGLLIGAR